MTPAQIRTYHAKYFENDKCIGCTACYVDGMDDACTACFGTGCMASHTTDAEFLCPCGKQEAGNCADCALQNWGDHADEIAREARDVFDRQEARNAR